MEASAVSIKGIVNFIKKYRFVLCIALIEFIVLGAMFYFYYNNNEGLIGTVYNFNEESLHSNISEYKDGYYKVTEDDVEIRVNDNGRVEPFILTYGPGASIPKGTYEAIVYYTASDENAIRLYSNSSPGLSFSDIKLSADKNQEKFYFTLDKNINDLEFHTLYYGSGEFAVKGIDLKCVPVKESVEAKTLYEAKDLLSQNGRLIAGKWTMSEEDVVDNAINTVLTYGPYITLPAGGYEVTMHYTASDSKNFMRIYSNELLEDKYEFEKVELDPLENEAKLRFSLNKTIKDIEVHSVFTGKGSLSVDSIEIKALYIDNTSYLYLWRFLVVLFLFICIDIIIFIFGRDKNEVISLVMIAGIAIFASFPIFSNVSYWGHDLGFHMVRLYGLCEELAKGNICIKMQPVWINDYAYPVGIFYGDVLLYIPATMHLAGIGMEFSYKFFMFFMNFLTVAIAYLCFKTMYGRKIGMLGTVLYGLSIYRIMDMHLRQAIGEYCAMTFLPLIVLAFYYLFKKEHSKSIVTMVIGCSGIVETHVLSTEMTALFIIIFCLVNLFEVIKIKRLITLITAVLVAVLINAGFLIPFLDYSFTADVYAMQKGRGASIQTHGAVFSQLFEMFPEAKGHSVYVNAGLADDMPLTIGIALMLGIILAIITLFVTKENKRTLRSFLYLGILSIFMSTAYFPWDNICKIEQIKTFVYSVQFAWRFFSVATVMMVFAICESIKLLKNTEWNKFIIPIETLLVSMTLVTAGYFLNSVLTINDTWSYNEKYNIDNGNAGEEYFLVGARTDGNDGSYEAVNADILDYSKEDLHINLWFESKEGASILLPMFNYKYFTCRFTEYSTGIESILPIRDGRNRLIMVDLPDNSTGKLSINFEPPYFWKISYLVSAISIALFIIYSFMVFYDKEGAGSNSIEELEIGPCKKENEENTANENIDLVSKEYDFGQKITREQRKQYEELLDEIEALEDDNWKW